MAKRRNLVVTSIMLLFLLIWTVGLAGCGDTAGTSPDKDDNKGAAENGKENWPKSICFAAAPSGGAWYPAAAAIAQIIEESTGTKVTVMESGGNINPMAISDGQAEVGLIHSFTGYEAVHGTGAFEKPYPNICSLLGIFRGLYQIPVRADSNILDVSDLKGKKISTGTMGQATVNITETLLKAYDLTLDDMGKVEYVPFGDASLMMKDGLIDSFTPGITSWPVSTIQDIASSFPIRLLPVSDEAFERIYAENDGYYRGSMPAGVYRGQDEEVPTFGSVCVLIASPDLPDDWVYTVMEAIFENEQRIASLHPAYENFCLEDATFGITLPFHKAAGKFYEDNDMEVKVFE